MSISRRSFLARTGITSCGVVLFGSCDKKSSNSVSPASATDSKSNDAHDAFAYLQPYVQRDAKWNSGHLFQFIDALRPQHLASLGQALQINNFESDSKPQKIASIHRALLWQSSHVLTYPFKSLDNIDYHQLVVWCGTEMGIPESEGAWTSTFDLEHRIFQLQFANFWDKLDADRRQELLAKLDTDGVIKNAPTIAAMSGASALAVLSTTAYFTGFSLYSSMSVVLCTVAGWLGVTLPFAAYAGASSTVAFLAGPVGWAICAVLLAAGVSWAGTANVQKVTSAVLQVHCLKAGGV